MHYDNTHVSRREQSRQSGLTFMNEVGSEYVSTVGAVAAAHTGVMHGLFLLSNKTHLLLSSTICPTCPSLSITVWIFAQYVFNSEGKLLPFHPDQSVHVQRNSNQTQAIVITGY